MTLSDLIARIEAASEGSAELDRDIYWKTGERERYTYRESPAYTSSIDSALLLVPEGWRLDEVARDVEWHDDGRERSYGVSLMKMNAAGYYAGDVSAAHDSFVLALVAAALRARSMT